jgi:hypothetical protein
MDICLSFSQRDRLKFFYLSPGLVKVCLRYLALVPPPYVSQFFYFCYIILACTFLFKLIIHNSMYLYEWEQVPSSLVRVYALLWIRVWEGKLLHHVIFFLLFSHWILLLHQLLLLCVSCWVFEEKSKYILQCRVLFVS